MGFQQLGWFPSEITTTIDNPIRPVELTHRYLYPGDTFINAEEEVVYYILETGIGSLNNSVTYYSTARDQRHTRNKEAISQLLKQSVSHQRCLAFGSHELPESQEVIYFYISYGETPWDKPGVYHAWWVKTSSDEVGLKTPTGNERNAVTEESWLQLRSRLRNRPSWDGVEYLERLVSTYKGLETTIDSVLETAANTITHRTPTDSPRSEASRNIQRGQLHKPSDFVPTVKHSETIPLRSGPKIYTADRFFVSVDDQGDIRGFPECGDDTSCLQSAEHLIVTDVNKSGNSATIHYFFEDIETEFSLPELEELVETVNHAGGRHLRCLARDGRVQVIGSDAPFVYSLHIYHVFENTVETSNSYYLLAYDKHDTKGVMIEHPLDLRTQRFEDGVCLLRALQNPLDHKKTTGRKLRDWCSSDENFADMCDRAATSMTRVGRERDLITTERV